MCKDTTFRLNSYQFGTNSGNYVPFHFGCGAHLNKFKTREKKRLPGRLSGKLYTFARLLHHHNSDN